MAKKNPQIKKDSEPVKATKQPDEQTAPKDSLPSEPSVSPVGKMNEWLRPYMGWILCALVICWAGIRISYFNSITHSPLYSCYSIDETDNKFFDDWGKYLNHDWLNSKPMHPYHYWHKLYADQYLKQHPEKLQEILAANPVRDSTFDPGKSLWTEWYVGTRYHQEPLYPYTLAVLYHFHIDEVKAMIILQLMLGVLSGIIIFLIARKCFGATAAVLTGIFYLFCTILMYNEAILLRTSWVVFLTVLVVYATDRAFSYQKPRAFFIAGLSIGFAYLMQSTFILYLAGALAIMLFTSRQKWGPYIKNSGLLIGGFFIMFAPVIIRNIIVGAPAFSISSVGVADIIACNVYGTESISVWTPSPLKEAEILGQTYNSFGNALITTLKTHPSVFSYFSLEFEKLKAAWSGIEFPNNENYYFYKQNIPVLDLGIIDFFLLAPLGLAGLIFCIYNRKKYYALYLAVAIQFIVLLAAFVLARFRAPLVILSLPLSAYAILECINIRHSKKPVTFMKVGVVVLLVCLSYAGYSSAAKEKTIKSAYYVVIYYNYFKDKLTGYKEHKQWDNWLQLQQQALNMQPSFISKIEPGEVLDDDNKLQMLEFFNEMRLRRSEIYDSAGNHASSLKELDTFKQLDVVINKSIVKLEPGAATAAVNTTVANFITTAKSFRDKKQPDSAIFFYKKALNAGADNIGIQKELGNTFLDFQRYDSASHYFKQILAANANDPDAINGMGCIYFVRKDYPKAIEEYKKAVAINPTEKQAYSNLGRTYFLTGNYKSALEAFGKERDIDPQDRNDIGFMIQSFQKTGKTDSVKKYETIARKNNPAFKI